MEALMNRIEVVQKIIYKKRARTYLEIGVSFGRTFFPIKARQKIAVDPNFRFSTKTRIKWIFKNSYNLTAKYYACTSDNFFSSISSIDRFDVVLIDGLHTYQQSLKDVINSLGSLSENGIIVMHDCNPPHQAAAYPAESYESAAALNLPGWTGEWCGDVWKTICYLRSQRIDLNVFVLDCDRGLGIVMKGDPDNCLNMNEEVLNKMTYEDLSRERKKFLNLKDESYFFEFLETI
jgi:hypothetical protein